MRVRAVMVDRARSSRGPQHAEFLRFFRMLRKSRRFRYLELHDSVPGRFKCSARSSDSEVRDAKVAYFKHLTELRRKRPPTIVALEKEVRSRLLEEWDTCRKPIYDRLRVALITPKVKEYQYVFRGKTKEQCTKLFLRIGQYGGRGLPESMVERLDLLREDVVAQLERECAKFALRAESLCLNKRHDGYGQHISECSHRECKVRSVMEG